MAAIFDAKLMGENEEATVAEQIFFQELGALFL